MDFTTIDNHDSGLIFYNEFSDSDDECDRIITHDYIDGRESESFSIAPHQPHCGQGEGPQTQLLPYMESNVHSEINTGACSSNLSTGVRLKNSASTMHEKTKNPTVDKNCYGSKSDISTNRPQTNDPQFSMTSCGTVSLVNNDSNKSYTNPQDLNVDQLSLTESSSVENTHLNNCPVTDTPGIEITNVSNYPEINVPASDVPQSIRAHATERYNGTGAQTQSVGTSIQSPGSKERPLVSNDNQSTNNRSFRGTMAMENMQSAQRNENNVTKGTEFREPTQTAQINEQYSEWKKNWQTDDFLFCPLSIAEACNNTSTSVDSVSRSQKPTKRHITRMLHIYHTRKKKNKKLHHDDEDDDMSEQMMRSPLFMIARKVQKSGFDLSTVLELLGQSGFPLASGLTVPCMQCYEAKHNQDGHAYTSRPQQDENTASTGRCANCGGKVQTLQSLSRMISNTKRLLADNRFELYDVYPDGNCMLRTVVDQLRVRGNFRYTIHSLREAVVDFLRRNPNAEDGTPFAMFLSGETWDEYLLRMSEDGQWGDHLVLRAISNILHIHIVIYGGISGETETNIVPDNNDGHMTIIHLLHMGETHYVSLRPYNWKQTLQQENFKYLQLWKQGSTSISAKLESKKFPMMHLDFVLRNTFSLDYITSLLSENVENLLEQTIESDDTRISYVGSIMCKLAPVFTSPTDNFYLNLMFPSHAENQKVPVTHFLIKFKIPINTTIHPIRNSSTNPTANSFPNPTRNSFTNPTRDSIAQPFDLYIEEVGSSLLLVRLRPTVPENWAMTQTMPGQLGTVYLKVIELPSSENDGRHKDGCIVRYQEIHAFQHGWPDSAAEWLLRERPSQFPTPSVVQLIQSTGCHIVPVISSLIQQDITDCVITQDILQQQEVWCYSFAEAEKILCSSLTDYQRQCYLLLKIWLDTVCNDISIPSFILKSVFFFTCENIERITWQQKPASCILTMINKLTEGFIRRYIPHYFIPDENLVRTIPEHVLAFWLNQLQFIQFDSITSLYFIFDTIGLTTTEVDGMLDEVIDDLPRYVKHRSLRRSFHESLVPAAGCLVSSLIYLGSFQSAMSIVLNVFEQWSETSNRVSLLEVIKALTLDLAIGYCWCLCFMMDTKLNTTLCKDLCHAMPNVSITDIFGPDIVTDMPNTVTPISYAIANGDLIFPNVCSQVIQEASGASLVAKCLRYYLETYSQIAGDNIVIDAHTKCQCSKGTCGQHKTYLALFQIYVKLLDAYVDSDQVEMFRDVMPVFTLLAEHTACITGSYKKLAFAWEMLGEKELAAQYMQSSPTSEIENCIGQLFSILSGR